MSASNWTGLPGKWAYAAGSTNATVTIPVGATIVQIVAHANPAGTIQIFGGDTVALPANDIWSARFMHGNLVATASANTIVLGANTQSYFIEYILPKF